MTLIVTRHKGMVQWLKNMGVEGRVIEHATEEDVRDNVVYGNLPFGLASAAAFVTVVEMPDLKSEHRGKDLSPEEMNAAGARLRSYKVTAF